MTGSMPSVFTIGFLLHHRVVVDSAIYTLQSQIYQRYDTPLGNSDSDLIVLI